MTEYDYKQLPLSKQGEANYDHIFGKPCYYCGVKGDVSKQDNHYTCKECAKKQATWVTVT